MPADITQVGDFIVTTKPDGDAWISEMSYPDNRIFSFGRALSRVFMTLRFPTADAALTEARTIIGSGQMK